MRRDLRPVALLALALGLRLVGLRWGLPDATHFFSYHPDEFEIAGYASRILSTGDFHPQVFNYGSLTLYLTVLLAAPAKALGLIETVTGTHVVGRLLSIALGTATVALVLGLARRLVDEGRARLAALFLALAPAHVLHSGFATVDATATFFVTATLLLALRVLGRTSGRAALLAGVTAGLATAAKYNAGLVLLAPLAAIWLGKPRRRGGRTLRCLLGALGAFLVAVPYAVLDFPAFRRDLTFELFVHPREGHLDYFTDTGNGWWYHLSANLPYALGVPLLLLALAGVVVMVVRRRPADLVLLAFAVPYFLGLGLSQVRFLRYLLPLLPFLALAAAVALQALAGAPADRAGRAGRRLPAIVAAVVTAWLILLTGQQQFALARPDPRTAAVDWLAAQAPGGASVGLVNVPWFYTPPITHFNGGARSRGHFEAQAAQPGPWRYVLCEDWNRETLVRERPDFVLLSEFEWREGERLGDARAAAFLAQLTRDYVRAATFDVLPASRRRTFGGHAPHDWLYPFAQVRVFRRR